MPESRLSERSVGEAWLSAQAWGLDESCRGEVWSTALSVRSVCVFASDNFLSDTQSEPPWASKYNSQDQSQKIKHLVHPGRAQPLALISTLASIKGVRETQSYNSANTAVVLMTRPGCVIEGQRLDGATVLEPFSERRQVLLHPALVQSDRFQSFLHAPHLRAALLQTGEEALHLHNTHRHTARSQTWHNTLKAFCKQLISAHKQVHRPSNTLQHTCSKKH